MSRWKLSIEYDGGNFHGWQAQDDVPTIQGQLQSAFHDFTGQSNNLIGAGRTDAGVHAIEQVAHVDLPDQYNDGNTIKDAVNYYLKPNPIAILSATPVIDHFHARYSAEMRHYRYQLIQRRAPLTHQQNIYYWTGKPLNLTAMQEGAKYLIGEHDFTSLRSVDCQAHDPVRTIDTLTIDEITDHIYGGDTRVIVFNVSALSFLHHMVCNIVGSLLYIGDGRWNPKKMKDILAACDRRAAGPTAPATGLFLSHIDYPDGIGR
jgi:tRNA pseudouridine38-40 synthase